VGVACTIYYQQQAMGKLDGNMATQGKFKAFDFTNKIHAHGLIFSAKEEYQMPIINTNM